MLYPPPAASSHPHPHPEPSHLDDHPHSLSSLLDRAHSSLSSAVISPRICLTCPALADSSGCPCNLAPRSALRPPHIPLPRLLLCTLDLPPAPPPLQGDPHHKGRPCHLQCHHQPPDPHPVTAVGRLAGTSPSNWRHWLPAGCRQRIGRHLA